ncbi:P-loop containing nucleoside triphosphate hydrolase protein [Coniella lustricola]|uniref:P-loop containing nucleoside triphosphate hydrolase protein n=1 Tax=Coniella lustricola TaxID=2025994 RepID=A0A2T3AKR8_9PEZI|nr:P-loop containing nucleoside triphosphate hydrolase protein [Coniella lustricola]
MDYHARHGHDVASFDLPSTHRMPTVSAAQALEDLDSHESAAFVSTSLHDLDAALAASMASFGMSDGDDGAVQGGIAKGQVTEIWGPPGVGKTAVGIQLASNVLRDGNAKKVVWVDCFHPVSQDRLTSVYTAAEPQPESSASDPLQRLVHYSCPSLAHFIALLCRPTQAAVPTDTALVVVDALSALVNHAFPRTPAQRYGNKGNDKKKGPSPSSRRIQVLQYIVNALQKLAATRDAAVVVLMQCATRMQAEKGATLVPAVNANVWEQGIATRIALFRDWVWYEGQAFGARLAAMQKVNGRLASEAAHKMYAFDVKPTGLVSIAYDEAGPTDTNAFASSFSKRKLDDAGFEVPDSDEDEYGWQHDDDSALPALPPQWQGSEDILLGQHSESHDDTSDGEPDGPEPEHEAETEPLASEQ